MIGPTGVGKTEIARRIAKLADAPFVKVEASKFTEVGYVGRDVESIVRDLMEVGIKLVREEEVAKVRASAERVAEERLLDALFPTTQGASDSSDATRERMRAKLRAGELEDNEVEIEMPERSGPTLEIFSPQGIEEMGISLKDLMGNLMPKRTRSRRVKVAQAREFLRDEEAGAHDRPGGGARARGARASSRRASCSSTRSTRSRAARHTAPDVSREGVQRDLLPIVEGTSVQTKHGAVRTDHILFIAAGAFHVVAPLRPDPRAAGPLPDPRRARGPGRGGICADPRGAAQCPRETVSGAARDRERAARVQARRDSRDRAHRRGSESLHREHRRAPAAHRARATARRRALRGAGPRRLERGVRRGAGARETRDIAGDRELSRFIL